MSATCPLKPCFSPFSTNSIWSCRRNGRVTRIRNEQKMLVSTLHAAKNATAATVAKPVNAPHSTPADTPKRCSTASSAAMPIMKVATRRAPITTIGGSS